MDEAWKRWSPSAQQAALERLRAIEGSKWKPFYCPRPSCDGLPHDTWAFNHARGDQHPPKGDWLTWLIRGGRGSGKTRSGSEWTQRRIKISPIIALVAPTGPAARDVMIEGESGILATAPPGKLPQWEPSKRKLTFPNGAIAHTYSAEEPDRLRGPQHHDAWLDEPAHYPLIDEVWSNLLFGLRLGKAPRICATTTPIPSAWIKKLVKDEKTVSVVVSTYANIANLAPQFAQMVLDEYEGTRRGRQEIHGEILEDVEGALWSNDLIESTRVEEAPELVRIVVAVDPAGTNNARSDETGIVVVGIDEAGHIYILEDGSGKYSPLGWADRTFGLYDKWQADCIVAEKNYGGDMVRRNFEATEHTARIEDVTSRRGKTIRADPVVGMYEKGKVHHVGLLSTLEDQLTTWVPGNPSPDRLDALVHGVTLIGKINPPSSIALPTAMPSGGSGNMGMDYLRRRGA